MRPRETMRLPCPFPPHELDKSQAQQVAEKEPGQPKWRHWKVPFDPGFAEKIRIFLSEKKLVMRQMNSGITFDRSCYERVSRQNIGDPIAISPAQSQEMHPFMDQQRKNVETGRH